MSDLMDTLEELDKKASPPGSLSQKEKNYVKDRVEINLFSPVTKHTVEEIKKVLSDK